MHIPDGYLSPSTSLVMVGAMIPVWRQAARRVSAGFQAARVPLIAIGAAFSFVVMMLNVPVPDGTTAHAVGGTTLAIVLGPWAASLALSVALLIQAVFFGDGGVLAFGANAFNIAFLLPFVGYLVFRLVRGRATPGSPRYYVAAAVASYVGISLAGLATGVELGLQPLLFHTAAGTPLYNPYGLGVAVPAMALAHLLVAGPVEAAVGVAALAYLHRVQPSWLAGPTTPPAEHSSERSAEPAPGGSGLRPVGRRLLWPLAILVILTPLGLIASGSAWGEWDLSSIGSRLGYIPEGMSRWAGRWPALFPDYSLSALGGRLGEVGGYVLSALIGLGLIAAVAAGVILIGGRRADERRL